MDFLDHKKYKLTLLWYEKFLIAYYEWGIKKSVFTDFKNVHLTLVKRVQTQMFCKKKIW